MLIEEMQSFFSLYNNYKQYIQFVTIIRMHMISFNSLTCMPTTPDCCLHYYATYSPNKHQQPITKEKPVLYNSIETVSPRRHISPNTLSLSHSKAHLCLPLSTPLSVSLTIKIRKFTFSLSLSLTYPLSLPSVAVTCCLSSLNQHAVQSEN